VTRVIILLSGMVALTGCAVTGGVARDAEHAPQTVVSAYLAALNRRDLPVLTAYVAPNVEWYSVVNGERVVEITNREALAQMLTRYFSQHERTQWIVERLESVDQVVAVVERSEWSEEDHVAARTSLAVYEVEAGRIRRMSYFLQSR